MITTLSDEGRIEIPETFRKTDALEPGQRCDIERVGRREYRLRVEASEEPEEGLFDVLKSCPVKDWWEEPGRDERTSLEPPTLFVE